MPGQQVIRELIVRGSSQGLDQVAAGLSKVAQAQGTVGASALAMAQASETATTAQLRAARAFDQVQAAISPAFKSLQQYTALQDKVDRAFRVGAVSAEQQASAMVGLHQRFLPATQANDNLTRSIGLQGHAWRNLSFQANDAITMLASGATPMQVLATQGGQVLQVLQGAEGGVSGALKDIGSRAGGLITPVTAGAAALAAMGIGAAAAFKSYSDGQTEVERSLTGLGRASGTTVGGLNDIAAASAGAAQVSVSSARTMAATFAATGKIGSELWGDLTAAAKQYAAATSVSEQEGAAALSKLFASSDLGQSAEQLGKQFGFLDAQTLALVRTFDAQGNRIGASRVLLDAFRPSIADATEKTSALSQAWDAVARSTSNAFGSLGKSVSAAVNGPEVSQSTLDAMNKRIEQQRNMPMLRGLDPQSQDMALQQLTTQRDALMITLDTQQRTAAAEAREAGQRNTSIAAQSIIRGMVPDQADIEQLVKAKSTLEEALKLPNPPGGTAAVLQTVTDRLIAGGTQAAQFGKTARDAFALSGLTGYARELETIRQKYRDLIESASKMGSLDKVGTLVMARDSERQAATSELLRTPSSYRKGVGDVPPEYRDALLSASARYNVDPNLGASVLWQESRFNPTARNKSGAAGIAQFMPGTAAQYGINPMDPQQAIPAMVRMLSERLTARNGNTALALADYNFGSGNVNRVGQDPSRFPRETRDYISSITQQSPDAASQIGLLKGWREETDKLAQSNDLAAAAAGRSRYEVEKAKIAQDLEADAKRRNQEITVGLRQEIESEASARARSITTLQQSSLQRSIDQDARRLGMTSDEQRIDSRLTAAGYGPNDPQREFYAQQMRINAALSETKDLASGAMKGFVSDMMAGKSAGEALQGVLGRITDKLLDQSINSLMSGLFSPQGQGGGGGLLGGLANALASGISGKADGGLIQGPGGPRSDNLLIRVSPGEYVVNAHSTARHRGVLDQINRGRPLGAFADGGFVPSPTGEFGDDAGFGEVLEAIAA